MTDFAGAYERLKNLIAAKYKMETIKCDVLDPNTGDLDGSRILVDYLLNDELSLFILMHLFGHSVQWNTSAEWRELGHAAKPGDLKKVREYEINATRYGIQALHEAGVEDLDQWASDCWLADWKFLEEFYRSGQRVIYAPIEGSSECLKPLPVPEFTPGKYEARWSF